jgi:hypothetical protein
VSIGELDPNLQRAIGGSFHRWTETHRSMVQEMPRADGNAQREAVTVRNAVGQRDDKALL